MPHNSTDAPPDPFPLGRSPLVGRARERALLTARLDAARGGRGAVALISGEPGVGKTRLLDFLVDEARQAGFVVLRGGASNAAGMPPYLPFLEALGQHVRSAAEADLRRQADSLAGPLQAFLPELAARLGTVGERSPLVPEQERFRLFVAVGDLLEAIAADAPLLLTLDDLQWADASTLDLLCAVAPRVTGGRLLIAGAFRAEEAEDNPAFARAFAELSRLRVLTPLPAAPLGKDAVADLAVALVGAPLTGASADMLAERSGGNPFFAEELLRHWLDAGAVTHGPDGAHVATLPEAVPATIRTTVGQRLGRLDAETGDLLRAAALAGRAIDPRVLARITADDPEAVEARLVAAARRQLVRTTPDGEFAFGHDAIREAIVADLSPSRRRRLHGFIAHALAQAEHVGADARAAEIAFHYVRSEDRAQAARWSRRAAERALQASAFAEAAQHLRDALAASGDDHAERGPLLLALGEAELFADDDAAAATLAAAAGWFQTSAQPAPAARALRLLGDAHLRREAHAEARRAFESALALLGDADASERIRLLVAFGTLLATSLHDHARGAALLAEAVDRAEDADAPLLRSAAARALGNARVRQGDIRGGIALLETALRLAEHAGDAVEAAECCACLAPAWFWLGEVERSAAVARDRLAHAERTRDPYQLRHVYTWLAVCSGMRGDVADAVRWIEQAERHVSRLASPEPLAFLDFTRGALAAVQGDLDRARPLLEEAIDRFRAIGPGTLVWYLGWLGVVYAQLGEMARARQTLAELEDLVAPFPPGEAPGEALAYLIQLALLLDDRDRLGRHRPALARLQGRFHDMSIDRLLGEIALREANVAKAGDLLAKAEAATRRHRLPYELARTLEATAELALRQAQPEAAAARLEEAAALLERSGAERPAARLREQATAAQAKAAARPAGLTRREIEVLRHVAAARSNREIAAGLFLSEKTVERHLSSIYAKTGAENRAGAVAFAIRHGLA